MAERPAPRQVEDGLLENQTVGLPSKCLLDKLGSCAGCMVVNKVLDQIRGVRADKQTDIINEINKSHCPEGNRISLPRRVSGSIW